MVCVYQALDGAKRWENESDVVPCQEEFDSMFNNNRQFLDFREAAVRGVGTENAKLGAEWPGICLGFTNTGSNATRDESENWSKIPVSLEGRENR